jgi:hypothetical protein
MTGSKRYAKALCKSEATKFFLISGSIHLVGQANMLRLKSSASTRNWHMERKAVPLRPLEGNSSRNGHNAIALKLLQTCV